MKIGRLMIAVTLASALVVPQAFAKKHPTDASSKKHHKKHKNKKAAIDPHSSKLAV
jgi:hypothetical protein